MLKIYSFILDTLELLQPFSVQIGRHDADLARQMRRAMTTRLMSGKAQWTKVHGAAREYSTIEVS